MNYVYWTIAYFAVSFVFSGWCLHQYFKEILEEYRKYHGNIKERLDYYLMSAMVIAGVFWPLGIVLVILDQSKVFFTSYISSKLESYAKRKHPEDFI